MIALSPIFIDPENEAQGIKTWRITLKDLPELQGSVKQIKWAVNIRTGCLHAFVDTMLRQGENPILHRHWWTAETQQDVRDVERALNDELAPMLTRTTHSRDWIMALDWDRSVNDAGVIARLLREEKAGV